MYKIDKSVPLPPTRGGGPPKYPWRNMKVGDSFFVDNKTTKEFSAQVNQAKKRTGFSFATRKLDGGVRVWRTA